MLGTVSAFAYRQTQGNREKPVSRWPVAGPSEYRLLASRPASKVKKQQYTHTHSTANTHKMATIHTRQLQEHTRPTNNDYTQDNLKLATIHTRQIRIRHVQKVKTPKQGSTMCVPSCLHAQPIWASLVPFCVIL